MKISQINQIKLRKLWCNSELILSVVVSTILSALLIAGPAIATCITKAPSSRETGSAINDASQSNRIVQIVHLTVDLPYNNNHSSDEDYVSTMIALLHDGRVYTWGNNIYGGVGNDTACTTTNGTYLKQPPCHYSQPQEITKYFGEDKVVKLASNDNLAMAITKSGKVYRWGRVNSYGKVINHPTQYQKLSPHKITGYNEENAGPDMVSGGKYVYNEDTIFKVANSGDLDDLAPYQTVKPQLDESTIRQVDHVWYLKNPGSTMDDSRGGFYVLTSKNKLLHVKKDYATTVEVTNPTIASRGGIKQIYRHYAIDNQGGLWHYGYGHLNTVNGTIVPSNHEPILDMSTKLLQPIPKFRDIIGSSLQDSSFSLIIRDINNRIYALTSDVNGHQKLTDVTDTLSSKEIKLFSGNISQPFFTPPSGSSTYYDYSFVTTDEDELDAVCSTVKNAYIYYRPIPAISSNPLRDRKPRPSPTGGDANTATCVKIPSNNPDPVQPPTPANPTPTPGVPGTPKLPGVPNTGSEPDPIVQLVHIPAVINGAINGNSENLTAKDTDYAGTVMVLTQSGRVFAWGNNYAGSVGVGTAGFKVPYPESVKSRREGHPEYYDTPQEITKYFGDDKVVRIGRYGHTSIAVTQSGKLYQWGWSYNPPWDWYDRLKNITWTEPTPDPTPSLNKVTGIGGSYGDTYSGGGWLAHGDDTIFTKTSTSQLKDFRDKLKLSLNGATIRSVDYVDFNGRVAQVAQQRPQDLDQSFRTGVYILTSTNKLLRVKNDGTTTEVTNDKIKSRGGIKQIANQYAIDNQGGLWYYGVSMSKDQIYDMSLKTLGGITPLPQLRDIVGIDLIEDEHMLENDLQRPWSSSVLVRSIDGHIYDVSPVQTGFSVEDGGYPERRFALTDVTKLLGHDKIKLFDGKIHSTGETKPVDNEAPGLYDYSYVPESKLDTVCTVISGVASANASQAQSLYGHGHPLNVSVTTTKLVNDVFAPTCVKLPPLLTPDPKPSPTPNPKPTKPTSGIKAPFDRPKAPGAPNTGSQPLFADGYQAPIFAQR